MKKPKIIKISNTSYFLAHQLEGQLHYLSSEFEVISVSSRGEGWDTLIKDDQVRNISVYIARDISPLKDLRTIWELIEILRKEKPDIVHTYNPKAGLLGMIASKVAGIPIRMHTITGFPLTIAQGVKRKLLWMTEWLTYMCATHIYPNSHKMLEIIKQEKLPNLNKMKVIGNGSSNGIDTTYFNPENTPQVQETNFPITFAFVGRIFWEKGINELIGAFARLNKEYTDQIGLRLIGFMEEDLYPVDDWVKAEIEQNNNIEFVGYQGDVRPWLLGCNVFVFPSYREGFPNVVMQAGALGLAQIVSDINGCNEIIQQGVNGIIIPAQDEDALYEAMKHLIEEPCLVSDMSRKSRELITSRYERRNLWTLIMEEYKQALHSH